MGMTDPFAGIGFEQKVEEQPQTMPEKQNDPFEGAGFAGEANDPFAGLALGGKEVKLSEVPKPETVGSTAERTGEPSLTDVAKLMGSDVLSAGKDLGSEYLDIQKEKFKTLFSLGGPAKVVAGELETIGNFAAGAISWLPSKIGLVVQTGVGKALQADDALRPERVYNLSDYDVAYGAEKVEQAIGNVLPSIIGEPKTEIGKRQTKFLGDIFETALTPLKTAADFYKQQGWPNFGNMVALTGELLMFKALHKYTPEMVDIGKRFIKADGKTGQAKVRAEKKLEEKQAELLKKINDDAKVGELQDIIKEKFTGELYSPERQALLQNKYEVERTELSNSSLGKKEKKKALAKLDEKYKQQQKEMTTAQAAYEKFKQRDPVAEAAKGNLTDLENFRGKVGQDRVRQQMEINQQRADFDRLYNAEEGPTTFGIQPKEPVVPTAPTMSDLSQRGRGFGGEVRKPNLGPEAVSGLKTDVPPTPEVPKASVEFISEEGIPRATYQIDNGKIKEVEKIGEQKTYQVNPETKKIELVESVPGKKSVYQILRDPLKNESGAVDIKPLIDMFGKAPKAGSLLNRLLKEGLSKEDLTLSGIGGYLAERKQKPVDWNEIKKLADEGGFDVRKEKQSIGSYKQHSLPGMKKGTYSENLYKYNPKDITKDLTLPNQIKEIYNKHNVPLKTNSLGSPTIDSLIQLTEFLDKKNRFNSQHPDLLELNTLISKVLSTEGGYNESHYPRNKNTMAWDRRHDRTVELPEGSKEVVYVEEMQSNWHRDGQQKGYGTLTEKKKELQQKLEAGKISREEYNTARDKLIGAKEPVPNAPFKKTWPEMIMRDVIADAVNKGKDGIAWSTGKIQVDRWGGKEASKRDAIYDKHVPKFFEREFGVKPEKVKTGTGAESALEVKKNTRSEKWGVFDLSNGRVKLLKEFNSPQEALDFKLQTFRERGIVEGKDQVWYVPITKKMRKMYSDSAQTAASIFELLVAPLRNEGGFIEIPTSRKKLLESTTPAFRENVRRFGELAEKSGKSMIDFLKDNNFSKKEIDQMVKVAEAVKLESPFKAPKTDVVISAGKDPLRLQPGEVNVNTGSKANPKMPIGDKFFEKIKTIKEIKLPPILQAITPTIHFIKDTKSPELLDLWHKTKAIEGNRLKDVKILKDTTGALREQYPKRKLREEVFIKMMSQDKLGREALIMLGIKPIDGPIKYEGLIGELNVQFKDLFNQLNTMRESIGKTKIAERQNYLPMIAQENFYSQIKQLFKGQEGEFNHPNMVLDSVQAINARHSPQAIEATALRHLKRRGLRKGVKLEPDPLKLFAQYGNTAYKHIHYSPFNMFVNQLTTGKFKAKNHMGKEFDWKMAEQKPDLHEFLSRWSNALAGKPNVMHGPALRFLEQGAQKLSSNLTAAVLGWSARTVLVQPTALLPTATEFGITPTVKGLMRTAMRSKKDPINRSQELSNRLADASMVRDITNQLKNPLMRAVSLPGEKALSAMKFVDGVVAEATWRTAFDASKHLGESAAIRLADEAVVRSQGSGFVGDLSPIQMNALGKAVTLWQTFTINNMNWLGREVLNIKNPERNPAETARRVMTYVIGTALINTLFEDQLGIQSPQPAPIKEMIRAAQKGDSNAAIALRGMIELTELAPFLSSLKFGSSPAGAVAEFLKELSNAASDDLPKALNGDKEAMKRVGFVAAKLRGVPGTQQVKRIVNDTPLGFPVEQIGKSPGKGTRKVRTKTTRTRRKR